MENQNVCKDCGGAKVDSSAETKAPNPETSTGNVCKDCGAAVKSGEGHGHKKEE